jgi:ribose-phosphate pyrophosphokinase
MEHKISVFVGPASERLGAEVCELLGTAPAAYECVRFPDGEMQMDVRESVRGCDVVLLQSTNPPVERHLMELLLLADACRRAGANRLTAVVPYFGYARQDRRSERRSLGARVVADAMATARFDRLMLIDAHTPAIEGFFGMPIDHLTAIPLLAKALAGRVGDDAVIVAPDFGAVKRAREFARLLQLPMAFVHKTRLTGETVETQGVIGRVSNRAPLIVDDMISTGATIEAAVDALRAAGAIDPITVVATHALLVGDALDTLGGLSLKRLIAANTVSFVAPAEPHVDIVSVAPLVATAITRDHRGESLADLRAANF